MSADIPPISIPRTRRISLSLSLLISLAALGVAGWQWYDSRQILHSAQLELARQLAENAGMSKEVKASVDASKKSVDELAARLTLVESRMNEASGQFATLQGMYQDLTKTHEDWQLSELEHALTIASQQLQLAANVPAAIAALEMIDNRLRHQTHPQLIVLRKSVSADLARLKSLPYVDVAGLSMKLDQLIQRVETLPLAGDPTREDMAAPALARPVIFNDLGSFGRLGEQVWEAFTQLVRIRQIDQPEALLLPPEQAFFLRENLKLRLLDARVALMQRDQSVFRSDLAAVEALMQRHFDLKSEGVKFWLGELASLQSTAVTVDLPDLMVSLNAVRTVQGSVLSPQR